MMIYVFFIISLCNSNQDASLDYKSKKRTIQRLKRGILPKNPTTVNEIKTAFSDEKIFHTYGHSLHTNEKYLFYDGAVETDKYSFCVFSSKLTVKLIAENIPISERDILLDATFRIVPVSVFTQLLIVYVRKQKKVCGFAF